MIVSCNSLILLPLQTSTHIETKPIFNSSLGLVSWLIMNRWMNDMYIIIHDKNHSKLLLNFSKFCSHFIVFTKLLCGSHLIYSYQDWKQNICCPKVDKLAPNGSESLKCQYKPQEGSFFFSLIYPKLLQQCQTQSKCSVSICYVSKTWLVLI